MRRLVVLSTVVVATVVVPSGARAATAQTDRTCYLQTAKTTVSINAKGFSPGRPYVVTLDGAALNGGSGTIDPTGAMDGAFNPPALGKSQNERRRTVTVTSDATSATASFTVTRFWAGFRPAQGNPATLRVRFSVFGFGLADAHPNVYVHYVGPDGTLRKTIRLGRAMGQCGAVLGTARRHLFPFLRRDPGKWKLQFDTSRTYHEGRNTSTFLFYTVGVRVAG